MTIVTDPPVSADDQVVVPGLEARHVWDSAVTLNDRAAWPQFRLDDINGIHSRADFTGTADKATGRLGEVPRHDQKGGKTLTYEGRIIGRSLAEMRQGQGMLQQALAAEDEREMLIVPHPDYGGPSYSYLARVMSFDSADDQTTRNWQRRFAIGLRMADPRFYGTSPVSDQTAAVVAAGGLLLPVIAPFVIPASAPSGTVTVANTGTAPTDPIFDIYGPVTNPYLQNLTTGKALRFYRGFGLDATNWVRVDFRARRVLLNGQSDASGFIDLPNSDWWDEGADGLIPGPNSLRLGGDTIADPAKAVVTLRPAFW